MGITARMRADERRAGDGARIRRADPGASPSEIEPGGQAVRRQSICEPAA